jgi:hypothetical protein
MSATQASPVEPSAFLTHRLHLSVTSDLDAFRNAAIASDRLLVELDSPDARNRGRLADFVFDVIERQLRAHGAAPRGWRDTDPFDARLDDQLYRARLLGYGGLALCFGSLEALAEGPAGLGLTDSTTLRAWLDVARERSVQLYVPERTAQVPVLDAPRALAGWLPPSNEGPRWAAIEYEGQSQLLRGALASMWDAPESLATPPHDVAGDDARRGASTPRARERKSAAPESSVHAVEAPSAEAVSVSAVRAEQSSDAELDEWPDPPASESEPDERSAPTLRESAPAGTRPSEDEPRSELTAGEDAPSTELTAGEDAPSTELAPHHAQPVATLPQVEEVEVQAPPPPSVEGAGAAEPMPAEVEACETASEPALPPSDATPVAPSAWPKLARPAPHTRSATAQCQTWMQQLRDMSGPKNHATIERTFVSAYVPLCREIVAGGAPAGAAEVAAAWAEGFAQSYSSAFKRMRSNRPRPRMVWDVMELALRWTTQFRTRSHQLLMVDGMRFDLGGSVNQELSQRLGARARCLDHALMWSGLPSNSPSQLKMFAPAPTRPAALELWPGRGVGGEPSLPGIERLEVGSRPLYRVSGLEEDLKNPGEQASARLERLAGSLATRIAPWIQSQTVGTLVVLFGDHGFHWQTTATGTTAAQCGGAMPEQVLVQASAWLVNANRPSLH